jgi:hypothetical protein
MVDVFFCSNSIPSGSFAADYSIAAPYAKTYVPGPAAGPARRGGLPVVD